jgi:hypothetical protein
MTTAINPSELPLRDIHIPEAISWWPLAIGWWITLALIPMLLWISFLIYKRLTRKTALKTAKKLLVQLKTDASKTDAEKLIEISMLIRRVAISISPREECASLTGNAWLEYLDKSLKDNSFTHGIGQCLADVSYRKNTNENINISELINLVERWLKVQKVKKFKDK